ncbi:ribosomal RNA small subunit methyltransferase E [Mycoplasmopsis californica HAZ160_1]|uniref:Ribosomal RNA small subunit methyltransferase E n=1 Tax=Mycoplasmopsis californica HAZ160_1 TaxID=1397850 RepID=A0AAT9F884_9BACT|nr:16S rRNA (uracil(1498)-N(3))-methyltransferase [Mycoplasmopsis californica]BAP01024.1 ribosomal RNA small subunit methyltransferase E [Mycoplasmopsis californica HAZ160_1]BBG40889.1 ribosomal RNA small subunit methyltransferase E [Mycoplasmopsis californica]BBG41483.1 ribosomal RNA small subunit methyltransferase E [Mycoplasmopsis californica]BBG42076.1 ribosomal RNA small subunit methyltransferase E [Mycoplasmopsis californica]BBG42659.1 ribosomal RNA small subunit methyltransferase E [Myc
MHRFFCDQKDGDTFVLDSNLLHHIKVARLENENFLINYKNQFYECFFEKNTEKAHIIAQRNIDNEFNGNVVLAAPIIKPDRFEWMLEKSVELGVKTIIPTISQYCNHKLIESNFNPKKYMRYQTKIKNAAEQSFRNILPQITQPNKLLNTISHYAKLNYTIYVAHETLNSEYQITSLTTNSLIVAGPEGGFNDKEIQAIKDLNYSKIVFISLGKRILRAETAAIAMLAKIQE